MNSKPSLFETLQKEFCPPLDSALLLALVSEITLDAQRNPVTPTAKQVNKLRKNLKEIATQATVGQLSEFEDPSNDTAIIPDLSSGRTTTSSFESSSESSGSSLQSFDTPLGFLQAALPHIRTGILSQALEKAETEGDYGELDMWEIISTILAEEAIRELEERGLEGLDIDDGIVADDSPWETVAAKKGKRKKNSLKLTLVDVRQQQHARPSTSKNGTPQRDSPAPDPWTQISSLSTILEELLPSHAASFFQTYFHSPSYPSPYSALCSALTFICDSRNANSDDHLTTHFNLLEVLLSEYEDIDAEQRSRLTSDIELCAKATEGRAEDAYDLAQLLRSLDSDASSGYLEMGVYHRPTSPTSAKSPKAWMPLAPPPVPPPLMPKYKAKPPPTSPTVPKPDPFEWQTVPQRKSRAFSQDPLPMRIPTYKRDVNGMTVRGSGNGYGKGGKGDVGELRDYRRKIAESERRRNELLLEATKLWQKGSSKNGGGQAAFYYAERARECQEMARKESLNLARAMVQEKRLASDDLNSIDLHGTTVPEALAIVQETLKDFNPSLSKTLKIITGRGTHSVNQVAVLKPALKKSLVQDGWDVGSWEAGLVVRGRRV
ncbi:hypothetical protein BDN72DRAFT_902557 [Pluteus cervinus]|uniref:Uncharacterized protein n=1 Tax=Pluteus cervinus TaxID=181527 RepID=A0ACD3AC75_9AGAR|nr:hypothetical protein BDN72DRAFT_902557 [Pluteus cervinus]